MLNVFDLDWMGQTYTHPTLQLFPPLFPLTSAWEEKFGQPALALVQLQEWMAVRAGGKTPNK